MPRPAHRCNPGQHAFTVVELMMGMAITALVMAAAAGLMHAAGTTWRASDGAQALCLTANQAAIRLQARIRAASFVGLVRPGALDGSAAGGVVLWQDLDTDGVIRLNEVSWIEFDPARQALVSYQCIPDNQLTGAQRAQIDVWPMTTASLRLPTAPDMLKTGFSFIKPRPLAGQVPGGPPAGARVTGATFANHALGSAKPIVEVTLRLERDGQTQTAYTTATLRAPRP